MKTLAKTLTTLGLTLFLSSCAAPPPLTPSAQPEKDLAIAENTFAWINAHRAKEGAKPLRRASALDRLARKASIQLGTDPMATFRDSIQGSRAYALQVLKYDSDGLSYQGSLAHKKEPGLSAVNYWSNATYSSVKILQLYTNVGIGSFTKTDGQTILTVILGRRFTYDPTIWNKAPRYR